MIERRRKNWISDEQLGDEREITVHKQLILSYCKAYTTHKTIYSANLKKYMSKRYWNVNEEVNTTLKHHDDVDRGEEHKGIGLCIKPQCFSAPTPLIRCLLTTDANFSWSSWVRALREWVVWSLGSFVEWKTDFAEKYETFSALGISALLCLFYL